MSSPGAIDRLATRLLSEGFLDNEADARLAAIKMILVVDQIRLGEPDGECRLQDNDRG